ncbi:MAG: MurR/RpiR family transcriptional regulator [Lachnospirales bacterium]
MKDIGVIIRDSLPDLCTSERAVGEFILNNYNTVITTPISDLADKSNVSRSTWIRFSKTLGFTGFKELKNSIIVHLSNQSQVTPSKSSDFVDVENFQNINEICNYISNNSVQSITDTFSIVDYDEVLKVATLIKKDRLIRTFGIGASGIVAQDLFQKFLRIGINVVCSQDFHVMVSSFTAIEKGDIVILFSQSGKTQEVVDLAKIAKAHGGVLIVVTSVGKNDLSSLGDYILNTSTPEIEIRSGAMGSRIAQLMIVDLLFTLVTNKNFSSVKDNLAESYNSIKKYKM